MKLNKFRVWFTVGWSEEDYLDIEAITVEQAERKVLKANNHWNDFEIQSIEPLD